MLRQALPALPATTGTLLLMVIMGTMWGLQFSMLKRAGQGGYSDLTLITFALVLLSVAFLALSAARGEIIRPERRLLAFFLVTAILGYIVPLGATLYAATVLDAGILTMIACLSPVIAVAAALVLRVESVSFRRSVAVGLGCISVGLITLPEFEMRGFGHLPWIAVAIIVPLCYGFESIYVSRFWPVGMTPLQAVTGETLVAALIVFPVFLLHGDPGLRTIKWSGAEFALLVFVAAGIIEGIAYFRIIQSSGAVFVNFGSFVGLVSGVCWGMVLFSETHGPNVWIAVAILVAALALATQSRTAGGSSRNPAGSGDSDDSPGFR